MIMSANERRWTSLDNAAKIFPATMSKIDTKVFRFSCELNQPVEPTILQQALEETIKIFPIFSSTLKTGLFWYYLEKIDAKPEVKLESTLPCRSLYEKNSKQLLFRVSYFKSRINLEVFHALSDGTGTLHFLKALVFNYIIIRYKDDFEQLPEFNYDASELQKEADSFKKYYNPYIKSTENSHKKGNEKAYRLRGAKYVYNRFNIIEGTVPVSDALKKSHEYNTTLTIFLIAILIKSIESEMEIRKKINPIVITVPINLRSFFDSKTIRNFFGLINVKYPFQKINTLENIIAKVKLDFDNELTEEKIQKRVNSLVTLENHYLLRAIPLFLKDFILRMADKLSSRQSTSCFSNIGKIQMPAQVSKYIRLFDAFISTNNFQISACSFENNLNISISSIFENTDIQKNFFRTLTDMGLPVEISTTIPDKDVSAS